MSMYLRENEKALKELAMLRYQADRYQATGNGAMSQQLNAEIRRIQAMCAMQDQNIDSEDPSEDKTIH